MSNANKNRKKAYDTEINSVTSLNEDEKKGKNKKKKKKKGCGCLTALIVIVSILAVLTTGVYFVGDYFAKQYLDCSANDIISTLNGLTSAPENKIIKKSNRYAATDVDALETALKDRMLLADDYKLIDRVSEVFTDISLLEAAITDRDIDINKLKLFVYDGPNATDVRLPLTQKGFAGLLDSIIKNLDLSKISAFASLPVPASAIELSVPQIFFLKEKNPAFIAGAIAAEGEAEIPEYIYSIKMTIKLNLRKLGAALLDEINSSITPWVSWLIPKNFFVTAEVPVNVGYETKSPMIYINNMGGTRMGKAFKVFDGVMKMTGGKMSADGLLKQVSDAIQPTLNTLNQADSFNFVDDGTGKTVLKLDIIQTVLQIMGGFDMETRDIYLVLKTILVEAGIDIDEIDSLLEAAGIALDAEFKDKYLLKEETTVSGLINDLMGDTSEEPAADGGATLAATEETNDTNKLLEHVDTSKISRLYDRDVEDLNIELSERMLASLLRDVLSAGDFNVNGMSFDIMRVSLSKNDAGNTMFGVMVGLSIKSLLGEDSAAGMGFLLNLLPEKIYIEAIINLLDADASDTDSGTSIIINDTSVATTNKVFDVMTKFLGEEFSVSSLTDSTADGIRDMINQVKDLIGLEFLIGSDDAVYAKLSNIFQLMADQMQLKDVNDAPVTDAQLKNLLSGLQIEALEDGNIDEVAAALIKREADETVDGYLNSNETGLKKKSDDFIRRLNRNYYIKEGKQIAADTLISGAIDADIVGVNSIDGNRLRNERASYNELEDTFFDERALTHIIKSKLEGEEENSLGKGVTLMQVTIDRDSSLTGGDVWIRLVICADMSEYAKDAAESLPGLIPDKLYITSITSFSNYAADIVAGGENESTRIEINSLGEDTALLIKIMKDAAGFDIDSLRETISNALKDSLTVVEENLNKPGEEPVMEYRSEGILLPNVFQLMRNVALTVPDIAAGDTGSEIQYTKLSPAQLMSVIVALENRPAFTSAADAGYYPSYGNFYNPATNEYDLVIGGEFFGDGVDRDFDAAYAQYFDTVLNNAEAEFEAELGDKYFLTNPVNTQDLFNTGENSLYTIDRIDEFDGDSMRVNTRNLAEMQVNMNERALAKIINGQLAVSDSEGGSSDSRFTVIAVGVETDNDGNVIFSVTIDASMGATADTGDLIPRIYLTATVRFNAPNAAAAKANKESGISAPVTAVTINQMNDGETALFKAMTLQLGVNLSFDTICETLENSLIDALSGLESLINIEYGDSGIKLPSIYNVINKMLINRLDTQEKKENYKVTDLQLKEMLENVDTSSNQYVNENAEGNKIIANPATALKYPAARDYTEQGYAAALAEHGYKLAGAEQTFYREIETSYYIKTGEFRVSRNTLMMEGGNDTSMFTYDGISKFDLQGIVNEPDNGKLENVTPYLSEYALANLFKTADIAGNDSNDLGSYSGAQIMATQIIVNEDGKPEIKVTVKLHVENQMMQRLLPGDIYITVSIVKENNIDGWQVKRGTDGTVESDINNLRAKPHSYEAGVTARSLLETFEAVLINGFGSGGGFESVYDMIGNAMKTAMNTLETQLPSVQYVVIPDTFNWEYEGTDEDGLPVNELGSETGVGAMAFPSTVGIFNFMLTGRVPYTIDSAATLKTGLSYILMFQPA